MSTWNRYHVIFLTFKTDTVLSSFIAFIGYFQKEVGWLGKNLVLNRKNGGLAAVRGWCNAVKDSCKSTSKANLIHTGDGTNILLTATFKLESG